ncbi:hypothetical protein GEMRC1_006983 [Eukaryota sp. GEM-RC1]
MTGPLQDFVHSSNDSLTTTDGTLDNVSSSCFSSMRTNFDTTLCDSLFRHKPSIYFHESLLILSNLHLIKRLINPMLTLEFQFENPIENPIFVCFNIKELSLKRCLFTEESITALCDLIRVNQLLTSFDFSSSRLESYELYFNLIDAIQFNSRLKKVTFTENNFGLRTLLFIIELISTGKLTSSIDIYPYSFDFSRGTIHYDHTLNSDELISVLDFLKSNSSIKHFTALGRSWSETPLEFDTDNGRFSLYGQWEDPLTADVASYLQSYLKYLNIKELTKEHCRFTDESIPSLCDLISDNNLLTSVDFIECDFGVPMLDDICSNLIDAIQCNTCLQNVTFCPYDFLLEYLLYIFELVSTGKLTSNFHITPHSFDFSNGSIDYHERVYGHDLVLMLNFLKSTEAITIFKCENFRIDTGMGTLWVCSDIYERPDEELSSLKSFLQCFGIKELTLKECRFTGESFTALCDLFRVNQSLTSFDFSGCRLIERQSECWGQSIRKLTSEESDEIFISLIDAIQCNPHLTRLTFTENNFGLKTIVYIFDLVSTGKLTPNIDVSPHSFDFSLGTIHDHDKNVIHTARGIY